MAKVEITAEDILIAMGFDVILDLDVETEVKDGKDTYREWKNFVTIKLNDRVLLHCEFCAWAETPEVVCKKFLVSKLLGEKQ